MPSGFSRFAALFALLVTQSSAAFAGCETVDLNVNTPLKDMPLLEQDGAGICYAAAASQLIDFKLRSMGKNQDISQVDLSLLYKSEVPAHQDSKTTRGGGIADTVEIAAQFGIAPKSCVDREIKEFTGETGQTSEQFLSTLESLQSNRSIFRPRKTERELAREEISRKLTAPDSCTLNHTLDIVDRNHLWRSGAPRILEQVLYTCSQSRLKLPPLKYDDTTVGSDLEIRKKLDEILNSKRPAGIQLCGEILMTSAPVHSLRGLSPPLERSDRLNVGSCSGHALLAVARKVIGGKCRYLLRNSWGARWKSEHFLCACKTSKKYYEDCESLNRDFLRQDSLAKTPEEKKALGIKAAEVRSRVYVGCWVDAENVIQNTKSVGSIP